MVFGSSYANEEITVTLPDNTNMEFEWIAPGAFFMGDEELGWPLFQVTLTAGFYLGKYETTQQQWEAVMGTSPWVSQDYVQADPNHPAVYISWNDIQLFIHQLNLAAGDSLFRLPTEAEWEYACRAGTTTRWSFGDDETQLGEYAWYDDNAFNAGEQYAHAVGTKKPNPWDLYDMHGNVWEWVQDWWGDYPSNAQVDPTGPISGSIRVARGGSFGGNGSGGTRSAIRGGEVPGYRYGNVGARLVRVGAKTPTAVTPGSWGQVKRGQELHKEESDSR